MARGVPGSGKTYTFRSPFTGQLIPQGQYRRELAEARGFAGRYSRLRAIEEVRQTLNRFLPDLTPRQRGNLLAEIAERQGTLGSFNLGASPDQRGSRHLPEALYQRIRSLGNNAYPIWRLLYR